MKKEIAQIFSNVVETEHDIEIKSMCLWGLCTLLFNEINFSNPR